MTSRLDRLFVLLEAGAGGATRRAAARQLGEVQRAHPEELHRLLGRLTRLLRSPAWETRVAASQAVEAILSNVPEWHPSQLAAVKDEKIEEDCSRLRCETFDIERVLQYGAHLMGSEGREYDFDEETVPAADMKERLAKQRQQLNARLGLDVASKLGVDLTSVYSNEDLCPAKAQTLKLEMPRRPVQELVQVASSKQLSSREMNLAKRKMRQALCKQKSRDCSEEPPTPPAEPATKKMKLEPQEEFTFETSAPVPDCSGAWGESTRWPLEAWCGALQAQLFGAAWEARHGAASALRELLRARVAATAGCDARLTDRQNEDAHQEWLEDMALRLLCVLALDRFGDFVSDQVVAPVRETCAQTLGVALAALRGGRVARVAALLAALAAQAQWEARHGALLGFKYLLHARQAPLPPPVWQSTLEAVDQRIVCPQLKSYTAGMNVREEDCLIANVYVPDTQETNLPVVIYIHGGGFRKGHGNHLTPKNLATSGNVIAVTFNYRLYVHGFLCLGTELVPGNAAMKDQVALLRWVNNNIARFGGNPEDVTIAGYSAGASSVDLLRLSDSAQGLFQKVILESLSFLGMTVVADPVENAKKFARSMNFTNVDDIYALEDFYTTASWDLLTGEVLSDRKDSNVHFAPCVERSADGGEFLKDAPANLVKSGQFKRVPMLYGFSNMEGIFLLNHFKTRKDMMNANFSNTLPGYLRFENWEQKEAVANQVKEFYFGNEPVGENNILKLVDYFGDSVFIQPVLQAVKLNVEAGNDHIYLYEYSFVDVDTEVIPFTDGVRGATHCSETLGVLDGTSPKNPNETNITEDYKKMKAILREMWSNFIKTGEPVPAGSALPAWGPVREAWAPHMELTVPPQALTAAPVANRALFWQDIYAKYYRDPEAPQKPPPRHTVL